ncbi:hypothetical protein [Flavisphingopyxis soli]|uniref:hypothetical protein n=1 Tax=Flavisphingopyxis soli TaxID=2601267 RepID=UPI0013762B40|nr:hypothetical protein [Sphingorhabdus soli]
MREAEIVAEFIARLDYLKKSYQFSRKIPSDNVAFNNSLVRLRRGMRRKRKASSPGERLHYEIEMVISHHARLFAKQDGCELDGRHIRKGSERALELLNPRRGRPDDQYLELHVQGLVALIQEFAGVRVLARRDRNSVYEPHFAQGVSSIIALVFEDPSEGVTNTKLVGIVRKTRLNYANRPLRFLDLFPGYGATTTKDGELDLRPGLRLEHFEPNIPIYCP